jgi:hypothetical protein
MCKLTLVTAAIVVVAVGACGGEEGTTGRRVVLHTRLVTDAQGAGPFVASSGWSITLRKAAIATGPLYYFDGAPAITQAQGARRRWLAVLSPIGTAHAHPGHYAAGRSKGQMLMPAVADLLASPITLADGDGITGVVRSGTFSFAPPPAGEAATALEGHAAVVAGAASKDGKTVHFAFNVDFSEISKTAKDGQVAGCPFNEVDVEGEGTVTVTVKPRVWFNLVDFAELAPGSAEAPTLVPRDSTAAIAFALGLAQLSAYQFSFSSP